MNKIDMNKIDITKIDMNKIDITKIDITKIDNEQIYFVLTCTFIYTYLYISFEVPECIINIYKNPIFKIIFLLGLYFFGYENIHLTFFLAINYVGLDLKIQNQELLK